MIYLGIDPGLTGALAVIDGGELLFHDCPTYKDGTKQRMDEAGAARLLASACKVGPCLITVEKVHSMPGQGVSSMFGFGYGFGVWMGILAALQIPHQIVTPQAWKKEMFAGYSADTDSRVIARRLWPEQTEEWLSRKKDHGRADAVLLAEFGRRLHGRKAA